jgi:hypothetical protein
MTRIRRGEAAPVGEERAEVGGDSEPRPVPVDEHAVIVHVEAISFSRAHSPDPVSAAPACGPSGVTPPSMK